MAVVLGRTISIFLLILISIVSVPQYGGCMSELRGSTSVTLRQVDISDHGVESVLGYDKGLNLKLKSILMGTMLKHDMNALLDLRHNFEDNDVDNESFKNIQIEMTSSKSRLSFFDFYTKLTEYSIYNTNLRWGARLERSFFRPRLTDRDYKDIVNVMEGRKGR